MELLLWKKTFRYHSLSDSKENYNMIKNNELISKSKLVLQNKKWNSILLLEEARKI